MRNFTKTWQTDIFLRLYMTLLWLKRVHLQQKWSFLVVVFNLKGLKIQLYFWCQDTCFDSVVHVPSGRLIILTFPFIPPTLSLDYVSRPDKPKPKNHNFLAGSSKNSALSLVKVQSAKFHEMSKSKVIFQEKYKKQMTGSGALLRNVPPPSQKKVLPLCMRLHDNEMIITEFIV